MTNEHPVKLKIFAAITALFSEGGVEKVTMANIGALCGLHKSSLVYYFQTKEEMLRAYYQYYLEEHDKAFFQDIEAFYESRDKTPESFCALIDLITTQSRDTPSLSDIASVDILYLATKDDALAHILDDKFNRMEAFFRTLFARYLPIGFLDERRFEDCCSDFLFTLGSILYLTLYSIRLRGHEEAILRNLAEVKGRFLKDGLYNALTGQ